MNRSPILAVVVPFENPRSATLNRLVDLVAADMERVNTAIIARTGSEVAMIPEVANHLISSGGKRLRPMLTLAMAQLAGYSGDGHVKLGVAAGDHAAIIWPLLCGMAKSRYYLMTGEMLTGAEAERIGLVSKALPREQVLDEAMRVAQVMATGAQQAIRLTKRTLNSWVRQAAPIFDQSAAYEMLCFLGPDVVEGYTALREKREPSFPSAR